MYVGAGKLSPSLRCNSLYLGPFMLSVEPATRRPPLACRPECATVNTQRLVRLASGGTRPQLPTPGGYTFRRLGTRQPTCCEETWERLLGEYAAVVLRV
ncbi:hypothetical protein ACOMHN_039954 [Nucella lapillus]